jgi:hypothetical protein
MLIRGMNSIPSASNSEEYSSAGATAYTVNPWSLRRLMTGKRKFTRFQEVLATKASMAVINTPSLAKHLF